VLGKLASNSSLLHVGEVLNCVKRQNMVGVVLFIFLKVVIVQFYGWILFRSWTKSALYSVSYNVRDI